MIKNINLLKRLNSYIITNGYMMKFLIIAILISTIAMSTISPIFAIGDNTSGHNHDKSKQPNNKPLQHHDKNPISKGGNPDNVKNVNDNTPPITHGSKGSEIPNTDKGNQGSPTPTPSTNTYQDNHPSTIYKPHDYHHQSLDGICTLFHKCGHNHDHGIDYNYRNHDHGGDHDHHNHDNHDNSHNDNVEVIHKTVVVHDNNNIPQTLVLNSNSQTCYISLIQLADIPDAVTQLLKVGCPSVTITPS